jgi:CCR4-NOT transcription complex subunit 6
MDPLIDIGLETYADVPAPAHTSTPPFPSSLFSSPLLPGPLPASPLPPALPTASPPASDRLFVRVSTPLAGLDVEAYAVMSRGEARRGEQKRGDESTLTFQWFREERKAAVLGAVCTYSRCPGREGLGSGSGGSEARVRTRKGADRRGEGWTTVGSYTPDESAVTADVPKGIECRICFVGALSGGAGIRSFFCSLACFARGWREHETSAHKSTTTSTQNPSHDLHRHYNTECSSLCQPPMSIVGEVVWQPVSSVRSYRPGHEDIGKRLKLTVAASTDGRTGLPSDVTTIVKHVITDPVLPLPQTPPVRSWFSLPINRKAWEAPIAVPRGCILEHTDATPKAGAGVPLRVVSYNILAEIFASSSLYPHCPLWALSANYRLQLAMQEILRHNADVICLQEVQADALESYIMPAMTAAGYTGLYKQKTREAMGAEGKVDGCALFIQAERLHIAQYGVIEFNDASEALLGTELAKLEASRARGALPVDEFERRKGLLRDATRRLMKDNVAQLAIVEIKGLPASATHRKVCVVNTHLTWDPAFTDTKLVQTVCLIREVQRLRESQHDVSLPIIMAGDFNSEPGSSVYKFIAENWTAGVAGVDMKLWEGLRTRNVSAPTPLSSPLTVRPSPLPAADYPSDPCEILQSLGSLAHSLPFVSSYAAVTGCEPSYTNYTRTYRGCLDYVWVTGDVIRPISVLAVPHPLRLVPNPMAMRQLPEYFLQDAKGKIDNKLPHTPATLSDTAADVLRKTSNLAAVSSNARTAALETIITIERQSVLDAAEDLGAARWRLQAASAAIIAGVPQLLTEDDLFDEDGQQIALPSRYYPSDHVALVFDLMVGQQAAIHEPAGTFTWSKPVDKSPV